MSKNLIYTIAIDHNTSQFRNFDYSQYCINSWKAWCSNKDIDFLVIDDHETRYKFPVWNKHTIFERVGDKYDKIIYVDSDTMVKWDAPNPFDLYDDEYCGVIDRSSLRWILNSIDAYKEFFPDTQLDISSYINAGVSFFSYKHKDFYDELIKFYEENSSRLDSKKGVGKEQTVLNFMLTKYNIKVKHIPPTWNLFSIHKKDMFKHNWQLNEDMTPFFIKYANIWHFTGFGIEDRIKIIGKVWNDYKNYYE